MIQTKEELFLAELGINTKQEIELDYGAKIKITDLLKKYETKQLLIHSVVSSSTSKKDISYLIGLKKIIKAKILQALNKK